VTVTFKPSIANPVTGDAIIAQKARADQCAWCARKAGRPASSVVPGDATTPVFG
jgi:hypothetical protein